MIRRYDGSFVVVVAVFSPEYTVIRFEDDRTNTQYVVPTAQLS